MKWLITFFTLYIYMYVYIVLYSIYVNKKLPKMQRGGIGRNFRKKMKNMVLWITKSHLLRDGDREKNTIIQVHRARDIQRVNLPDSGQSQQIVTHLCVSVLSVFWNLCKLLRS